MSSLSRLSFAAILFAGLLACEAKTMRLGIVVGDNQGGAEDPRLHYAEEDAQKMSDLFQEVGGIAPENLILLKSPQPEHVDLAFNQMTAKSLAAQAGDEILFFFYYSGHGTAEALKLGNRDYPLADLKKRIDAVPAKLHVAVLDACQSGAITRMKGAKVVQPFLLEQSVKSNGSIFITSSSDNENSQESDQLKGSFFTHYWLSALRGAGDVSGDRRVSLLEAYEYAFNQTVVQTKGTRGGAQHPNAQFKLDVEGDIILTDLNNGSGGFVFGNDVQGDILVADNRAEVMGEFYKERGKEIFMALPAGNYRFYQKDGRVTRQGHMEIANQETHAVTSGDFSSGFLFAGLNKGGADEAAVALPWKPEVWPNQHPLEMGFGFYLQSNQGYTPGVVPIYRCLLAQIGYRILPSLDVLADYTFPIHTRDFMLFQESDEPEKSFRLSLRAGKFLSPNFEGLAKVFHRADWRVGDHFGYDPNCTDTDPACTSYGYRDTKQTWHFLGGTGAEFSVRVWLWSQLSLEASYGFEYNWWEKHVNGTPIRILPALHF